MWKEVGCRKDYRTFCCVTKRSVEDVSKKNARRSTDCILPVLEGSQKPRSLKTWTNRSRGQHFTERSEVAKRNYVVPSVMVTGRDVLLRCECGDLKKLKNWRIPVEDFRNHVATDGSQLGVPGKWRACGWSVVQLDLDEEMGPMHGMYGTLDVELEVQRNIKRAELTAFLCLFRKCCRSFWCTLITKELLMGGEMRCIGPRAKDADLCFSKYSSLKAMRKQTSKRGSEAGRRRHCAGECNHD